MSISAQSKVSLCVVEVYPLASNAALGKPTTASAGGADAQTAQVRGPAAPHRLGQGIGSGGCGCACSKHLSLLGAATLATPPTP